MIRRQTVIATMFCLGLLSSGGCAAIQGEQVESGMSENRNIDLEPAVEPVGVSPVADAAGPADDATLVTVDGDRVISVEEVLAARPISALSPEWSSTPQAWDFVAPELFSGAPVSGRDLYQTGSVLLTFVSPGCSVSIEDGSAFAESAEWNPTITYVFVHTDGDSASFEAFVEKADLYQENAIHINDSDLTLWSRFGIETQPSTVLLDRDGRASVTSGGLGHEGLAVVSELVGPGRA